MINGDFSQKPQIFPTPVYLRPRLGGFLFELVTGARCQTLEMMGATGLRKKFDDIFSRLDT